MNNRNELVENYHKTELIHNIVQIIFLLIISAGGFVVVLSYIGQGILYFLYVVLSLSILLILSSSYVFAIPPENKITDNSDIIGRVAIFLVCFISFDIITIIKFNKTTPDELVFYTIFLVCMNIVICVLLLSCILICTTNSIPMQNNSSNRYNQFHKFIWFSAMVVFWNLSILDILLCELSVFKIIEISSSNLALFIIDSCCIIIGNFLFGLLTCSIGEKDYVEIQDVNIVV